MTSCASGTLEQAETTRTGKENGDWHANMTDERTGMDYLVLVERPYTEAGHGTGMGVDNRHRH